jgi:hypothetical protein
MSGRIIAREGAMNALHFLVHLIVGTVGVPVAAAAVTFAVVRLLHQFFPALGSRTAPWILTETPYFPVQIAVGLLPGFLLGRLYRHRAMQWMWTMPAVAIALLMLFVPLRPVIVSGIEITKAQHFFGWACLPQNHCFDQVAFTLPLYAAGAYALGAFAARMMFEPLDKAITASER